MPAIAAIAGLATAGAAVAGVSAQRKVAKAQKRALANADKPAGTTPEEQRFRELEFALANRELDIREQQALAMNQSTKASALVKIIGAVAVAAIVFLILRKKKVLEI